jgi:hypothetical protein
MKRVFRIMALCASVSRTFAGEVPIADVGFPSKVAASE